jgi:hypothetical protein
VGLNRLQFTTSTPMSLARTPTAGTSMVSILLCYCVFVYVCVRACEFVCIVGYEFRVKYMTVHLTTTPCKLMVADNQHSCACDYVCVV